MYRTRTHRVAQQSPKGLHGDFPRIPRALNPADASTKSLQGDISIGLASPTDYFYSADLHARVFFKQNQDERKVD